MTAIEWIKLAKKRIESAKVKDYPYSNVGVLDEAIKHLNEAIEQIEIENTD